MQLPVARNESPSCREGAVHDNLAMKNKYSCWMEIHQKLKVEKVDIFLSFSNYFSRGYPLYCPSKRPEPPAPKNVHSCSTPGPADRRPRTFSQSQRVSLVTLEHIDFSRNITNCQARDDIVTISSFYKGANASKPFHGADIGDPPIMMSGRHGCAR